VTLKDRRGSLQVACRDYFYFHMKKEKGKSVPTKKKITTVGVLTE
jgi:hypothetical protein